MLSFNYSGENYPAPKVSSKMVLEQSKNSFYGNVLKFVGIYLNICIYFL